MNVAVVGAGWAGLAAAVRATQAGHRVVLYEMAAQLGGRARGVTVDDVVLDNGQHILIGAYAATLDLLRTVGCDIAATLDRRPLELRYPDGRGLRMPSGPAWLGFGLAVARCKGWTAGDRWRLTQAAAGWALRGFRCPPELTVDRLCAGLPPRVRELLIDPLCVAALNTPAAEASAAVWLRVLRDALFSGPGAADLLLPRHGLDALLPGPAGRWLQAHGADVRLGCRVQEITRQPAGWNVDGVPFDEVVLACTAGEAARLVLPHAPDWSALARALRYEPIVTVYLDGPRARLPAPMTALVEGPRAPAQFAFDQGAIGGAPGCFAFVVSGARAWVDAGLDVTGEAVLQQAREAFPAGTWPEPPVVLQVLAEKRATFRCTPGLARPPAYVADGLWAAGDYVAGPYPATLEGAVRAGIAAVELSGARTAPPAARR